MKKKREIVKKKKKVRTEGNDSRSKKHTSQTTARGNGSLELLAAERRSRVLFGGKDPRSSQQKAYKIDLPIYERDVWRTRVQKIHRDASAQLFVYL